MGARHRFRDAVAAWVPVISAGGEEEDNVEANPGRVDTVGDGGKEEDDVGGNPVEEPEDHRGEDEERDVIFYSRHTLPVAGFTTSSILIICRHLQRLLSLCHHAILGPSPRQGFCLLSFVLLNPDLELRPETRTVSKTEVPTP